MLPDVGAGAPWTVIWVTAAIFLLGLTIVSGGALALFNRSLQKRDAADADQDKRIELLDTAIHEAELKSLERGGQHEKEIHAIQMDILRCQKDVCANRVTKEEYLGDMWHYQESFNQTLGKVEEKVDAFISRAHDRMDSLFGGMEPKKHD